MACATRPKGQVRAMHDPVEKPVAEHAQANHPGSRAISVQGEVREANCERPSHDREQAVRNRIVVEIERRDTGDTWRDADMLEAEEQKDWPDEIQESCGENKGCRRARSWWRSVLRQRLHPCGR